MDPVNVLSEEKQSHVCDLLFVRDFVRMCSDGYAMGWHERNGGNASYRLRDDERAAVAACLDECGMNEGRAAVAVCCGESAVGDTCAASLWLPLDVEAESLNGEWLLITATGSYMRNVADQPEKTLGIVELRTVADAHEDAGAGATGGAGSTGTAGATGVPDATGIAGATAAGARMEYRVVWGFEGGGRPTSELAAHVLIHDVKKRATKGKSRVLYHCHPTPIIALSHVLSHDARAITRLLWRTMTECVMVFPQGIGVVSCEVPGSMKLANMTAEQVKEHDAVMWAQHGLLATGSTCDDAFGLLHVIVKAAQIYETACIMAGGAENLHLIPEAELPRLAAGLGVTLSKRYFD